MSKDMIDWGVRKTWHLLYKTIIVSFPTLMETNEGWLDGYLLRQNAFTFTSSAF